MEAILHCAESALASLFHQNRGIGDDLHLRGIHAHNDVIAVIGQINFQRKREPGILAFLLIVGEFRGGLSIASNDLQGFETAKGRRCDHEMRGAASEIVL